MRLLLIAIHVLIGGSAVAAGQAFVRDPSGKPLAVSTDWLERSPFRDYRVPGLFLALVVGGSNLLSALALWRRAPRSPHLSLGTGLLLIEWLGIQTGIIGFRHWSQAIWWSTFPFVAILAGIHLGQARRTANP